MRCKYPFKFASLSCNRTASLTPRLSIMTSFISAQHFGESSSIGGSGVVVCGSPNETPNDPAEGYQFDVSTRRNIDLWGLGSQREHLWVMVGLTSEDQLRQRVAWVRLRCYILCFLMVSFY